MKKIGWIGIGNMGKNMARLVMSKGYEMYLFDTNKQMQELLKLGATAVESAADLARQYNVPLPITAVSTQYYNAMVASGRGNYDYAAILLVNEENCGIHHDDKI